MGSQALTLENTISDLELQKDRPINLKIPAGTGQLQEFKSCQDAIDFLRQRVPTTTSSNLVDTVKNSAVKVGGYTVKTVGAVAATSRDTVGGAVSKAMGSVAGQAVGTVAGAAGEVVGAVVGGTVDAVGGVV